jgi:hypothetical protein
VIVLDENLPEDHRQLLRHWRIAARQIGFDLGRSGMKDDEVIPFLQQLPRSTFFTLDAGFYRRLLCHSRYCLVHLDVEDDEAAEFTRRLLRHLELNSVAKRMGAVVRVSHGGISLWRTHAEQEAYRVGPG